MSKIQPQQQGRIHTLYYDHHNWLYNWLRRQLGCSHSAADLAQDTYVRIITSTRMPTQDQARSYLVQIAKGLVIDRYRRQHLEQAYLEALSHQPQQSPASPEEHTLILESILKIDAMLFGLKPIIRETFLLSRFDGLTYKEIAEQLNISIATVRKYMLKAMQGCINIVNQ